MAAVALPANPTSQQLREILAYYKRHNVTETKDEDKTVVDKDLTFRLNQRSGRDVRIRWRKDISEEQIHAMLKSHVAFEIWKRTLEKSPQLIVEDVFVRSLDAKRPFFTDLQATIRLENSDRVIQGNAFLRGHSVAVLVVLTFDGEDFTLVVMQSRVPPAMVDFPEIPAGANLGGLTALAALHRRTGLTLAKDDFINLTEHAFGNEYPGIVPSAATCDEFITLHLCQLKVERKEDLDKFRNKVNQEDPKIDVKLRVVPLADLWQVAADAKSLSALTIYHHLKLNGSLLQYNQRDLVDAMTTTRPDIDNSIATPMTPAASAAPVGEERMKRRKSARVTDFML